MRVRDIVRRSFDLLQADGTLPSYRRQRRFVPPPPRYNMPWRPEQLEILHHGAADGSLYDNTEKWGAAIAFIKAFTAAAAGRGELPWRVEGFCGSLGEVPADDLLHRLSAVLASYGMHPAGSDAIAHTVTFEATDNPKISALPEPYGKWLQVMKRRPRWGEPAALRLVVRARACIVLRSDGGFDSFVDVALSAPAVSLLHSLAADLGGRPPHLGGRAWLPSPERVSRRDSSHAFSKGSLHARRF